MLIRYGLLAAATATMVAPAHAAPFVVNSIDAGCGGDWWPDRCSNGSPIISSAPFYHDEFGNNYPPHAAFVNLVPTLEEDSYIAMDHVGPSSPTHSANSPGASTPGDSAASGHFVNGNTILGGGWYTGGGVASGVDPWGGAGLMVAHLTTHGELSTYEGSGVRINFEGIGLLELSLNGPPVEGLSLRSFVTPSQFGNGNRHQIWITDTLAPGDADLDGDADFDDLNVILSNWGRPGPEGDVNQDGSVDFDDLNELLDHWDG